MAFQQGTQIENFADIVARERGDEGAAIGQRDGEALAFEAGQRFADRGFADVELDAELAFAELRAGRQLEGEDGFLDGAIGEVGEGAGGAR